MCNFESLGHSVAISDVMKDAAKRREELWVGRRGETACRALLWVASCLEPALCLINCYDYDSVILCIPFYLYLILDKNNLSLSTMFFVSKS